MSVVGLDWPPPIQIPFLAGLNTKAHAFVLEPPGLTSCKNIEFDEVGALRLRKPYASIGVNIFGGGTLSNVRKLAVVGDELLCFTSTTLYSWSETLTAWVSKGAHAAVAVTEVTRFGNPNDQVFADRAQLSGTVVMVWTEVLATAATAYLAAYDATTGAIVLAPVSFGAATKLRPRVVATTTKIIVTWIDGAGLVAKAFDPASPSFVSTGATTLSVDATIYDIVKDPAADQAVYVARNAAGNLYRIGKVTAAMAVTASNKTQTCDGVIAVSCAPAASGVVTVLRYSGGNIKGDNITLSTLADLVVDTTVGAPAAVVTNLTGAHRSVANGGQYRCYAFWTAGESAVYNSAFVGVQYNYIDTAAAVGAEGVFIREQGIAARAFDYGGTVYLWSVFGKDSGVGSGGGPTTVAALGVRGQFQNTYFMHSDDQTLVTKSTWQRAGGLGYYNGHIPGVALVSGTTGFAWAGTERQIAVLGGTDQSGYSARAPRDIGFTFDSDDARRVVQVGATAYVSGGLLLQYDGQELTEVGFQQYPWHITLGVTGGAGLLEAGDYSYKGTLRRDNARGETERSTTAIGATVTVAALDQVNVTVRYIHMTRSLGSSRSASYEIWRTVKAAPNGAPFYLVTSRDPAATGDNGYFQNAAGSGAGASLQGDVLADATLITKEQNPENDASLPRLAPPGASIILASDTRLFLAGIPGEPYRIWYSLTRNDGEVAAFHGALSFSLPATTGPITGLAFNGGTLVAFTATAIYAIPGDGFDNTGGGSNYGPPRIVSSDVGATSHDSIALTPAGLLFFGAKGWYRLSTGWDLDYIGAKVEDFNADTWVASQVVESQHQVRFLSGSRMLMWDYLVNEWSEWSQASGRDLAMWRGSPMLLDTLPKKQQSTFTAVDYYMELETGWIKPAGLTGFARLRRWIVLGQYKADHAVSVSVGYDYASTYTDSATMGFTSLTVGNPTEFRQGPSRQRIQAFRLLIRILGGVGGGYVLPPAADCTTLVGLGIEVGMRKGLYPRLAAAQKQ